MTRYVCLSMGCLFVSLGLLTSGCIIDECDDGSGCWYDGCDDCAGVDYDDGRYDDDNAWQPSSGSNDGSLDDDPSKDTDEDGARDTEQEGTNPEDTSLEDTGEAGCDTESNNPEESSSIVEDGIRGEYACGSLDKNGCQADVCAAISALDIPSVYMCSSPCGDCEYVASDCEEVLSQCLIGVCVDPDEADFGLLVDCSILYRNCVAGQEE